VTDFFLSRNVIATIGGKAITLQDAGPRLDIPSGERSMCGVPPAIIAPHMDPSRKRKIRLVVALTAAVILAVALIYTSFNASSEAKSPSQLVTGARVGQTYQLTGKVVPGSIARSGTTTSFRVEDRAGGTSVPVRYTGSVPDPFAPNREVIVDVRKQGATFVGEKDSLVTKCPSKYQAAKSS
jgi:cytochrome c-type biogenesis protein CcmE